MGRPVAVAVDLPRLELDRPFTYLLPEGVDAPVGSVVSGTFHGRTVHGWVLGETEDVPPKVLPVRRVLSKEPSFDRRALPLFEWLRARYIVPLCVAIGTAIPPRVASEEGALLGAVPVDGAGSHPPLQSRGGFPRADAAPRTGERPANTLGEYDGGSQLIQAVRGGSGAFVVRPLPDEEAEACVEAVTAAREAGRGAIVVVPEASPLPATARAVLDAVGGSGVLFAGGDRRGRYRTWLEILRGRYPVVVGTRPAVFSLVPRLGLVWVHRDAHAAHREERTPAYHPREVALARGRLEGAVCVLGGASPSAHAAALVEDGDAFLVQPHRDRERASAPLVETTRPGQEDRSLRLAALLKQTSGAFLLLSRRGYGMARVCRSCSEPARCAICAGPVARREGRERCVVCGAEGRCASCGAGDFGIERGGTERVEEWARGVTGLPVRRVDDGEAARPPERGEVLVGTAAAVKDFGGRRLDLVGILDADRGRRRPGTTAGEQVLATWMEAASWAGPRREGGRVLVQTREHGDPAVQALVRWDPLRFHRVERRRLAESGFPPGAPVFRLAGRAALGVELETLRPVHLLVTTLGEQTVCLVTVDPGALPAFRERVLELVGHGIVSRVEAEPRL